jgi:hypothetical protein
MWGLCFILHGWGGAKQGSCEIDQIELLQPATPGPQKPWVPIFDGRNLDGFYRPTTDVWRISNGALVCDPNAKNREAMRTSKLLGDAEVRIRFDILQDIDRIYFAIRQEEDGRYMVSWTTEQVRELKGRPHELLFVCRGEDVSATLDGNRVPIEPSGRPREGCLHFGCSSPGLRIFSIDYRELR